MKIHIIGLENHTKEEKSLYKCKKEKKITVFILNLQQIFSNELENLVFIIPRVIFVFYDFVK